MNEASLSKLPRPSIHGLDTVQIEKERKDMWRNLFQKYENISQTEKDDVEYLVNDIGKQENVSKIFQDGYFSVKANVTLRQFMKDHADELDEISTIMGPAASDEEILSDFSDEEILELGNYCNYNYITSVHDLHLESMSDMKTSESDSYNDLHNDNVVNSENNNIHVKSDVFNCSSDYSDEDILYAPLPPLKTRKKTHEELFSFSKCSGNFKPELDHIDAKTCVVFNNDDDNSTKQHTLGTHRTDEAFAAEESNHSNANLVCCICNNLTFYEALEATASEFICDDCMVGDHRECIEEDCETCKEIGKHIEKRWDAEVVARVLKQWS